MTAKPRKKSTRKAKSLASRSLTASKASRVKGGSKSLMLESAKGTHYQKIKL